MDEPTKKQFDAIKAELSAAVARLLKQHAGGEQLAAQRDFLHAGQAAVAKARAVRCKPHEYVDGLRMLIGGIDQHLVPPLTARTEVEEEIASATNVDADEQPAGDA